MWPGLVLSDFVYSLVFSSLGNDLVLFGLYAIRGMAGQLIVCLMSSLVGTAAYFIMPACQRWTGG